MFGLEHRLGVRGIAAVHPPGNTPGISIEAAPPRNRVTRLPVPSLLNREIDVRRVRQRARGSRDRHRVARLRLAKEAGLVAAA